MKKITYLLLAYLIFCRLDVYAGITDYTPNTNGIVDGQIARASQIINNLTAIQTSINNSNLELRGITSFKSSIELNDYIRNFDISKVSTGTNTIAIGAGAVTFYDSVTKSEITGWAALSSTNIYPATDGYIWAIYPGKTYVITDSSPSNKPATGFRVAKFTVSNGTVTVTASPITPWEAKENIFETNQTINGNLTVKGTQTISGLLTGSSGALITGTTTLNGNLVVYGNMPERLPAYYYDVKQIIYSYPYSLIIPSGARVRSSDDTNNIIADANITVSLQTVGANGLDTGAIAANTWYYLYFIKNSSTGAVAGLFSTVNESASGSVTLPTGYDKKRQLKLAVRTNSNPYILPFVHYPAENRIMYLDYFFGANSTAYNHFVPAAGTVSLASWVPPISTTAIMGVSGYVGGSGVPGYIGLKPTYGGYYHYLVETGIALTGGSYASGYACSASGVQIIADASQQVTYTVSGSWSRIDMFVQGFIVTGVK